MNSVILYNFSVFQSISIPTINHFVLDTKEAQSLINHPVHILDPETDSLSPSAFIPFCDFAGDMTKLGRKIPQFALPVCTSFTRSE